MREASGTLNSVRSRAFGTTAGARCVAAGSDSILGVGSASGSFSVEPLIISRDQPGWQWPTGFRIYSRPYCTRGHRLPEQAPGGDAHPDREEPGLLRLFPP